METTAVDRAGRGSVLSRLEPGEWLALGAAALLLLSMLALDWFALTVANQDVPESGANAFEALDGADQVLVVASLAIIAGLAVSAYGLVRAREAAVVTGAAGILAALVVLFVIVSPPDVVGSALEPYAGGIDARMSPQPGALLGLALAASVVAGSVRMILRKPPAPAPGPVTAAPSAEERVAPVAAPAVPEAKPARVKAKPATRKVTSKPKPRSKSAARKPTTKAKPQAAGRKAAARPKSKPKPAARKRTAKPRPKPAPRKRAAAPKAPAAATGRVRLATASADDLVAVGFTPTQAERIVSYRDDEALVSNVADLKRVPGIAKPVLAELVKRLED